MKLKKSNLILLIFFVFFFSSTLKSHALSPDEFIQLMTGWVSPDNLKIYENEQSDRDPEDYDIISNTMPIECEESSDCKGDVRAQSVETGIIITKPVHGDCIKQDEEAQFGICEAEKGVSTGSNIIGTDFSEEVSNIPKLQEGISHYFQPTPVYSNNILSFGSHQLLLSEQDQISLKIDYLKKAKITSTTVENTGEYPLGGVEYDKEIACEGNTITPLQVWNSLPGDVKSKSRTWYEIYRKDQKNNKTWTKNIFCIAPYRTLEEDAFGRSSILLGTLNLREKESIYTDSHVRGTFDASLIDARLTFPSATYKKIYNNVRSKYPLITSLEDPGEGSIPSVLLAKSPRDELDLGEFAKIIDGVEEKPGSNYRVIGGQITKEEADAVKDQGFIANIFESVSVAIAQFFNVRHHFITIPGIAGQATEILQQEIYSTQIASNETSNTDVTKLSNSALNTGGDTFFAGSGGTPGFAKNTISRFFACNSRDYSSFDTSIKDYVLGARNSCNSDISLTGSCDGKLFRELYGDELPSISGQAKSQIEGQLPNISDQALAAYKAAEEKTGLPCEVLAGVHWREGGNNDNQDLQEGAGLGGRSLVDSAIQAAEEIEGKVGISKGSNRNIETVQSLVTALSRYNGGGNANCRSSTSYNCSSTPSSGRCGYTTACATNPATCTCTSTPDPSSCRVQCEAQGGGAFPFQFSFGGTCPPRYEGYDDPYSTNLMDSEHDTMYILYQYDCTQTKPILDERSGSFTFAAGYYDLVSK